MWNSKPKQSDCKCSKRTFGNPKIGCGICEWGVRDAVTERINNKRISKEWLKLIGSGIDPDDIDL